jgi:PadR family transcriptional regulator, regulatory protein PadR
MVDPFSSWVTQLRKGVVELLVLRLLVREGQMHGYGIVRELQALGDVVAGESTVYPILKRLEAEGALVSGWTIDGSTPRKYYQLTSEGRAFLERGAAQWRTLVEAMKSLEVSE